MGSGVARFHVVDPDANARLVEAELATGSIERARQRLKDAKTRHPDADALVTFEETIEAESSPDHAGAG